MSGNDDQVSQTAEFFRIRAERQKEDLAAGRNFRLGMAAIATASAAKIIFGRRGA